ncbi:MAG TPA: tetraacyldisaccharide 4'-kinase, partial [Gemmatimonadaceae bacterium]|nr:tetraacyldisaccharide 4'-kinase [Gemmatimonadaceae bacterium]
GAGPAAARAALAPFAALYAGVVAARGWMYDHGLLPSHDLPIPSVSVGNLSVGGTGKTPLSAWIAAELRDLDAAPAIVLRRYGGDEPLVHSTLNPDVPVIVDADRVRGVNRAMVMGARSTVLDDAFQHRRARRSADIVLLSADRWQPRQRLLPAGPWREPVRALRRASLVIVTRKAAGEETAAVALRAALAAAPDVSGAVALLALGKLHLATGPGEQPLSRIEGADVLAVSAVGDPGAFAAQLRTAGAANVRTATFPDHHHFTGGDAAALAGAAAAADLAICTLKDAVKLAPLWPRQAGPLWYVSQRVEIERGQRDVDRLLHALAAAAAARTATSRVTT